MFLQLISCLIVEYINDNKLLTILDESSYFSIIHLFHHVHSPIVQHN